MRPDEVCPPHPSFEQPLYSNHRNYLYQVPELGVTKFLLFNPSIHYWLSLNASAAKIIEIFRESCSLKKLLQLLEQEHLVVSNAEFENDVIPFIETLLRNRFLTTEHV